MWLTALGTKAGWWQHDSYGVQLTFFRPDLPDLGAGGEGGRRF